MSYILDALRKADAERERGAVPGLHAQPLSASSHDDDGGARRAAPPWLWFAAGVAAVGVAAAAWKWMAPSAQAPAPIESPAQAAAATASPEVPANQMAAPAFMQATPTPAAELAARRVAKEPAKRAAPPTPFGSSSAAHGATTTSTSAALSASVRDEDRVYAQRDLPEAIRRDLPALAVGGSMYSAKARDRFLIINGQIFHEHDNVAPGLTLEEIKLKSAVFKFRDYRYSATF